MCATHVGDIAQRERRPNRTVGSVERCRAHADAFVAARNLGLVALWEAVARRALAESHGIAAIPREEFQQLLANERGTVSSKQLGGRAIGVGDAIVRVGGQDAVAK